MQLSRIVAFIFFLIAHAQAATPVVSVSQLEKNARAVQKEVDSLAKEIALLEKDLGKKNHEFLTTIKSRQEFELRFGAAQTELAQNQAKLNERSQKLRQVLKHLALQELDQNQSAAAMAAQRILSAQVKQELNKLQKISNDTALRENELRDIKNKVEDFLIVEQRLGELMRTMEERKKEQADAYLSAMAKKGKVEERLSELKLNRRIKKVKANADISNRFSSPIEEFLGVEYDKKGITYKFTGRRPVIAAEAGEVVYAGRLSTYGNVVLIDHGNETRSVILGQFVPKLNKGQKVARHDVLGYTENLSIQGKLYFEVRKRDKAQDTIALMEDNFLTKNSITKI